MRIDHAFLVLIGGFIIVSQAVAQRDVVPSSDPLDVVSGGHRVNSVSIRPWEKPTGNSQAHVSHISTEGLVGYWPFNGDAHDESENGNDGSVFGGAALTEDRFNIPGSAYYFDGLDDFIGAGDSEILRMVNSMSMMAWIKPDFIHTGTNGIILNREGEYEFARSLTDEIQYAITNSNPGWYWVPVGYDAPAEEWTHIAITYDGGLATTYVNGQVFFVYSGAGPIWDVYPSCNELRIGHRSCEFGYQLFHGVIDDVRIYNRAVTPEEVLDIYNETPFTQFGICYGATGSSEPLHPGSIITIDPLTGAGTLVGPTGIPGDEGPSVPALAIKSTGEMYALSAEASSGLYLINASTGVGTFLANTGLPYPDALAVDASDQLYAVSDDNILYTVDDTTGGITAIGRTGFVTKALAYDPTDGTMYGCSATDEIFMVDLATGASTLVGITGLGGLTHALYFDQQGQLYGTKGSATTPYTFISINKLTGEGTTVGPIGFEAVIGLASRVLDTGVSGVSLGWEQPTTSALLGNYPNPFNPSTTIRYALKHESHVTLKVYNMLGQPVATLVDELQPAGYKETVWNGSNDFGQKVSSGTYIYRINAGSYTSTKRMLLLK